MDLTSFQKEYLEKLDNSSIQNRHKPLALSKCLEGLKKEWHTNKDVASLWEDWPKIAGDQLSSNCSPINFQHGILTIGVTHPHWIQALLFTRNQLLASLKSKGHKIKEIRIKQDYPQKKLPRYEEEVIWNEHPSRSDIHGKTSCPCCNNPAPRGEILLWGKCSLCRRVELK